MLLEASLILKFKKKNKKKRYKLQAKYRTRTSMKDRCRGWYHWRRVLASSLDWVWFGSHRAFKSTVVRRKSPPSATPSMAPVSTAARLLRRHHRAVQQQLVGALCGTGWLASRLKLFLRLNLTKMIRTIQWLLSFPPTLIKIELLSLLTWTRSVFRGNFSLFPSFLFLLILSLNMCVCIHIPLNMCSNCPTFEK